MSASVKITTKGQKELIDRMVKMGPKISRKILRTAVTKAARPIRAGAKANVPVRFGLLKRAIDVKVKAKALSAYAVIGANKRLVYTATNIFGRTIRIRPNKYIHLVESGVRPHEIRWGKHREAVFMHPGSAPTHFMERAASSTASGTQDILAQAIAQGIQDNA